MRRAVSLILATVLLVLTGCASGPSIIPPTVQNQEQSDTVTENTDKEESKELVITNTFYPQYPATDEYDEMKAKVKKWFDKGLENGTLFRAELKDVDFEDVTKRWVKDIKRSTDEKGHENVLATFTDAETNMRYTVEATLYADFPTVDFVVWAENISETENSPIIEELYGIYSTLELAPEKGYTIHTALGSTSSANDFSPVEEALGRGTEGVSFSPNLNKGHSTDGAWPYFNVTGKNEGIILAVGWTGIWEANFSNLKNGEVTLKAHQYHLNATLFPGERIRSTRAVVTCYDGEEEYGQNIWRKLVIEHYTPDDGSEDRFVAPLCINFWGGIRENYVLKQVKAYEEAGIPFDAVWFDAGWNSDYHDFSSPEEIQCATDWDKSRGWWTVNKKCYPSGSFKKISDLAHSYDKKLMVWWMIEDAMGEFKEHWSIGGEECYYSKNPWGSLYVLKLCDDEVLEKLLDYYDKFFKENGLDWVRVDNGDAPYSCWITNDDEVAAANGLEAGTRLGVSENGHILNYYKLWDTLAERYPDFVLDNCCSGGRRLDIEMTKRGIPLWRTDYDCDVYDDSIEARQAQTQWLSKWIPLSGTSVIANVAHPYNYRCYYSAGGSLNRGVEREYELENFKKIVNEYAHVRPYWYGSYYQILKAENNKISWQAYELFREDWQKGMLVLTRRENAVVDTMQIKLKGLLEDQKYLVHSLDDDEGKDDVTMTGKELMETGISFSLLQRMTSVYEISIVLEQ